MPLTPPAASLDLDLDNYPPLLDPQTLVAKIFLIARAISLLILLALVTGSAQILRLVREGVDGAESPVVVVVLLIAAASGMAYVLLSLACLATRRLPSLALIWVVDLLFSSGLVALMVFVGREVTGTCDAGAAPFGLEGPFEQRDDVCKKLSSMWILGMAGGGLFIASGVTVSDAASGFEDGGYGNQMPGPSRGGSDDVQGNSRPPPCQESPAQRTSISSALSRTFEYDGNRGRDGGSAAQQSAQPNSFTS
ncbi:hypothetical protein B0T18DRAFT_386207 [Schizothecium vesticola]|uniref:Uncharacterized protein n=1 Tax=Schizothecium vesticola TaxID=314040 RepID=A0AA40FAM3_9PEZI|nr:hypothetical protein B0T18DRAFT_386207 [Schizothecium vesticola]